MNVERPLPGLYIHVPFCKTKCPYCDFYSVTNLSLINRWFKAVREEMGLYKDLFEGFDSIYLGGGTPSVLDEQTLFDLLKSIRTHWSPARDTEITIEVNPDDVTGEKLLMYRSLGINRLSIGVQSFDDHEISFLKRRHTSIAAKRALDMVGMSGFDNFGIDLIYGLPGQTEERWLWNLQQALAFGPSHLSCYQLTIENHTPFGRLREEGAIKDLTEKEGKRFFLNTSRFLEDHGFIHYEISNFARSKTFMSRHNRKYWGHTPYLGLGPGAHSFQGGKRWWNHRSLEEYCEKISASEKPVEGIEALAPEQVKLEKLYFGFRTKEGFPLTDLPPDLIESPVFADLKRRRYIVVRKGRIIPTRRGFLIADRLPLIFSD